MKQLYTYILLAIIFLLLGIVPQIVGMSYWLTLVYTLLINIILAKSWNIVGGFGGQVFLGMAAFFGLGAYACAMLYLTGVPPILCILLGGLIAACLAIILTPTFRLRGVYFVIGSLFVPEIMKVIVLMLPITGGAAGIVIPVLGAQWVFFAYYSALILALAVTITTLFITKSKIGMVLRAIRDDQDAAEAFGINPAAYKFLALILTAIFCGMAGGTHAFYMVYVEPHGFFEIGWSTVPVFMVLVGGPSTLIGPVIGVAIYTLLRELFTFVAGEIYLTMLGALLIIVMLTAPTGVYPVITKFISRARSERST
ncbi:MAG: branched-chain amino acid ABC transporter permease [Candidatus Bathyarchaeia archaeon]